MSSHSMPYAFTCSLEALTDENYSYFQDDYIAEESLFPIFGNNPNKRKPKNKPYEWEKNNAACYRSPKAKTKCSSPFLLSKKKAAFSQAARRHQQ